MVTKRTTLSAAKIKELARLGAETLYRQLIAAYPDLPTSVRGTSPPSTKRRVSRSARAAMSAGMRRFWRRRKAAMKAPRPGARA